MSEGSRNDVQGANKVGQILLIVGAIVLALLLGVLIGRRGEKADPATLAPPGVQISTEEPAARPTTPLVAPVQAPPTAPIAKLAPETQVQEDAAAVGLTTRDEPADKTPAPAPEPASPPTANSDTPPAN